MVFFVIFSRGGRTSSSKILSGQICGSIALELDFLIVLRDKTSREALKKNLNSSTNNILPITLRQKLIYFIQVMVK